MKHQPKSLLAGVLCVLASGATALAAAGDRNNPYAAIAILNAFRLSLPAPHKEVIKQPDLPRIKLQGVTNICGRRQVLMSVQQSAKPGQPAGEIALVLSEGESVGEIKVLEIDEQSGTVKFNNHGAIQTLKLRE